jgi:hypothetical protein
MGDIKKKKNRPCGLIYKVRKKKKHKKNAIKIDDKIKNGIKKTYGLFILTF